MITKKLDKIKDQGKRKNNKKVDDAKEKLFQMIWVKLYKPKMMEIILLMMMTKETMIMRTVVMMMILLVLISMKVMVNLKKKKMMMPLIKTIPSLVKEMINKKELLIWED
jgi:hypothetical protein